MSILFVFKRGKLNSQYMWRRIVKWEFCRMKEYKAVLNSNPKSFWSSIVYTSISIQNYNSNFFTLAIVIFSHALFFNFIQNGFLFKLIRAKGVRRCEGGKCAIMFSGILYIIHQQLTMALKSVEPNCAFNMVKWIEFGISRYSWYISHWYLLVIN